MSIKINPLSAARGQKFECEICGQPAKIACAHCRVAFYCAKEHQHTDWTGIHETVCPMLPPLRNPSQEFVSEDERRRHELTIQMNKHALIDLARGQSTKFLAKGEFELAIPGALQSLRFSADIYGKGHVELVKSYLLVAEANAGLQQFQVAEQCLSVAQWSMYKQKNCSNGLRSQLHRLFGKIYSSQGRLNEALHQLALDVYYCSLDNGPEHITAAAGMYLMGLVFLKQENIETALAFYDKVVDIWYKLLSSTPKDGNNVSDVLDNDKVDEAIGTIQNVMDARAEFLGADHIATGEAAYVLGMLTAEYNYFQQAFELLGKALNIYEIQVGSDHALTLDIRQALERVKAVINYTEDLGKVSKALSSEEWEDTETSSPIEGN